MKQTVCIYHKVDIDGWLSAAIVNKYFIEELKENIDFIGYNYNENIPNLKGYKKIIMCDISFPKDKMQNLKNLVWIDHHISAINDMKDFEFDGLRDTKFAACELTWQYFYKDKQIPELVTLCGLYDSFRSKGTSNHLKVIQFQYGVREVIIDVDTAFELLQNHTEKDLENILNNGKTIYNYVSRKAKQTYENGFEIMLVEPIAFQKRRCICINSDRFNPINFDIDYHKDGYDCAVCFNYANNVWNFSIYNDNGKVDCSRIAKDFKGGGHRGASGFVVEDIQKFLKENKI